MHVYKVSLLSDLPSEFAYCNKYWQLFGSVGKCLPFIPLKKSAVISSNCRNTLFQVGNLQTSTGFRKLQKYQLKPFCDSMKMASKFEGFESDTTQAFLIRKPKVLCINKYPNRSKKCNQNIAAAENKAEL